MTAKSDMTGATAARSDALRLATLGEDAGLVELLRPLVEAAGEANSLPPRRPVRWTTAVDAGPELSRLAAGTRATPQFVDWQQLLGSDQHDLILVAGRPLGDETAGVREEQLRRLFQGTIPLVIVHPACEMILAYELEMIRKDTGVRVFPFVPLAERPELLVLRAAARSAGRAEGTEAAGGVEQWIWERSSYDRSRDAVLDDFARDALVLRELLGEIKQVTAVGGAGDEVQFGQLTVHLTAAGGLSARWSILPARGGEEPRIRATAIGAGPSWTWDAQADGSHGQLEGREAERWMSASGSATANARPALMFWQRVLPELETVESRITADGGKPHGVNAYADRLDWEHVCRGLELTDGVERSCRRRRTIDLYHEQVSEQATFKSLMAAGGCAMLFWVLAMLMVAGMVDAMQLPIRDTSWWRLFPVLIFLPLGVFLGLQLLQLVFPPSGKQITARDLGRDG